MSKRTIGEANPSLSSKLKDLTSDLTKQTPPRRIVNSLQTQALRIGNTTQQYNAIVSCAKDNGKGVNQVWGRICDKFGLENDVNWEAYKVNSGDTIENKSKRLITLIPDVLEPKIRTFENPTDPSLVRDIQIINDIAMSKETNIPKSISYRPIKGSTIKKLIERNKSMEEVDGFKSNSNRLSLLPLEVPPVVDSRPLIKGIFEEFEVQYEGVWGMLRYITNLRSGKSNEYNEELKGAVQACLDFCRQSVDMFLQFGEYYEYVILKVKEIEAKSDKVRLVIKDILDSADKKPDVKGSLTYGYPEECDNFHDAWEVL